MSLDDAIASAHARVFFTTKYFAETVTFTPASGEASIVTADVGEAEVGDEVGATGQTVQTEKRAVMLSTDPGAGGIDAADVLAAKITYGGQEYEVDAVQWRDERTRAIGLIVKRYVSLERARPGARRIRW